MGRWTGATVLVVVLYACATDATENGEQRAITAAPSTAPSVAPTSTSVAETTAAPTPAATEAVPATPRRSPAPW